MSNPKQSERHNRHWHLSGSDHEATTTDFEWSIIRFQQAFERYVLQLASTSGLQDLSFYEIVILHVIRMQDRPKTAAIIARQMNRDDIPNIQYSLRKLVKLKLVRKVPETNGKIYAYEIMPEGREMLADYAQLRQEVLTRNTSEIEEVDRKLQETTRLLGLLTGVYDEAGRVSAALSINPRDSDKGS